MAVKKKLLSMGTLTNPSKLLKLYQAISSNIQTDLTPWEIMKLAPLAKQFSSEGMTMRVLTNAQNGELVNQIVNGAYMLFPKKPDWSEIRDIAQHPFGDEHEATSTTSNTTSNGTASNVSKSARIEIRNGTFISGLASQVSTQLKTKGFEISTLGNAAHRTYEKTVIYDLTNGKRTTDLEVLKKFFNASVEKIPSFWSTSSTSVEDVEPHPNDPANTDFLVILGTDSSK